MITKRTVNGLLIDDNKSGDPVGLDTSMKISTSIRMRDSVDCSFVMVKCSIYVVQNGIVADITYCVPIRRWIYGGICNHLQRIDGTLYDNEAFNLIVYKPGCWSGLTYVMDY